MAKNGVLHKSYKYKPVEFIVENILFIAENKMPLPSLSTVVPNSLDQIFGFIGNDKSSSKLKVDKFATV